MKSLIAAVVAGIILLIWGMVSWTALTWRDAHVMSFSDEAAVIEALHQNSPKSGIYYIPQNQEDYEVNDPVAFINVTHEGSQAGFPQMMLTGLVSNVAMALVVVLLLGMTQGLSYLQRVGFVVLVGLVIGLGAWLPNWNWFSFPTGYTVIGIVDSVIMWFLAGLAIAKLAPEH